MEKANCIPETMLRSRRGSGGQSQREIPSSRFRSLSHSQAPYSRFRSLSHSQAFAHRNSNRPPTTNANSETYVNTISTYESRNTHRNRANDNRSRSPERRYQPILQFTPRFTPQPTTEALSPFDPHSNAFQEAYITMMTSMDDGKSPIIATRPQYLLVPSSADPIHHRSNRGKEYHSRSPPSRCQPILQRRPQSTTQPAPQFTPRSTPHPTSQQPTPEPMPQAGPRFTPYTRPPSTQSTSPVLSPSDPSPFDPSSPVFRQAYQTMISSIDDESILINMPSASDEDFLRDLEDMVREYLTEDGLGSARRPGHPSGR